MSLIYSLINISTLTTGRRLYALRLLQEIATPYGNEALDNLIAAAIAHEIKTSGMEQQWSQSKKVSTARGRSFELDSKIDALLGALFAILTHNATVLDAGDAVAIASKEIISRLFVEGVHPIIVLPFEEQLMMNTELLKRLNGDLADAADKAGVKNYVDKLVEHNTEFRTELAKKSDKEIEFNALEAARSRGNLYLRQIVALVLGIHHQITPEAAEARKALLTPILEQCDRIRQARKGRRSPPDVDPDTGEELQETASDA